MKEQDNDRLIQGGVHMVMWNIKRRLYSLPHTSKVWLLSLMDNKLSIYFHGERNEHH